jgi:hypothetical protein
MTPILVWEDDEVSIGMTNLGQALTSQEYGHADCGFRVFVVKDGALVPLTHDRKFSGWDDSDYGYPRHTFSLNGESVFSLSVRVDGRV